MKKLLKNLLVIFAFLLTFAPLCTKKVMAQNGEVKFIGTVIIGEVWEPFVCYGAYSSLVEVQEIISDPEGILTSGSQVPICYGEQHGLSVGELVDCFGFYYYSGPCPFQYCGYCFCGSSNASNYYVIRADLVKNRDTNIYYGTIQDAINANETLDGHTIFVRAGTYYENVVVNKSISLLGEDKENTVVGGGEVGTVIRVDSDNVTINGFEIRNCSMIWSDWGIDLNHSSKSVISGNIVKAVYAIRVKGGSENTVKDNDVMGHDGSCVFHGLQLVNSSNNVVNNNNLSVNCHSALTMSNSNHNFVSFNYISGHFVPFPFTIEKSSNNSIVGNTMWQPAPLFGGHIHFTESNGNVLYHNSFLADEGPNTLSIDELSTNNTWDNGCEGNYWSNYTGIDTNNDGIGDTSYVIDGNNVDSYPLMNLYWDPADTNHDLKVDIFDVVLACVAYMSTPIDSHWNCHCDIAEPYGVIDIFDIVLICSSYGEEYPP